MRLLSVVGWCVFVLRKLAVGVVLVVLFFGITELRILYSCFGSPLAAFSRAASVFFFSCLILLASLFLYWACLRMLAGVGCLIRCWCRSCCF